MSAEDDALPGYDWHYDAPPEKWRVGMLLDVVTCTDYKTGATRRSIQLIGDNSLVTITLPHHPDDPHWKSRYENRPGWMGGYECDPEGLTWKWEGLKYPPGASDSWIIGWHPGIADHLEKLNKEVQ